MTNWTKLHTKREVKTITHHEQAPTAQERRQLKHVNNRNMVIQLAQAAISGSYNTMKLLFDTRTWVPVIYLQGKTYNFLTLENGFNNA